MDTFDAEPISILHVAAIPHPGRGHIIAMMNVCRRLSSKRGLIISFVVTEEWLGLISSEPKPANVRLRSIPNVLPSEKSRGADLGAFFDAVFTKMEAPVERLLDQLEPAVSRIIADTFLPWALAIGSRRNISVASLWTMSSSVFSIFYHFDLLRSNGHYPFDVSGEEWMVSNKMTVVYVVWSIWPDLWSRSCQRGGPYDERFESRLFNGFLMHTVAAPILTTRVPTWYTCCSREADPHCGRKIGVGMIRVISCVERGDESVCYFPGISSIRLVDLPTSCHAKPEIVRRRILEAFSWVHKAQCLLIASIYELEAHVTDTLRAQVPFPIYTVGPLIPNLKLQDGPTKPMGPNHVDYFNWLDSQPSKSVLYISLGSYIVVSGTQMDEIAAGLRASGAHFLWATRGDIKHLQQASGEMGLVVPWCDQLRILNHPSIAGFLTHCGWNSTVETISAGLIMLTFPLAAEQPTNVKLIVEDWKVGVRVRREMGSESVVKREEIARIVQWAMNLDGDENREMSKRAKEIQETCKKALEDGGSSNTNFNAFVRDILYGHD